MKKKTVKKLVLAKETLRGLEAVILSKVAAGAATGGSCRFCDPEPVSYTCTCP